MPLTPSLPHVAQLPAVKPRGVYRLPFLGPTGETVLVAIDAAHRCVALHFVRDAEDVRAETRALAAHLDRVDPRPLRPPLHIL